MAVTPEHEAPCTASSSATWTCSRGAMNRILDITLPTPDKVSVLTVDLTETVPVERRMDSVLLAEFAAESGSGRYILVIKSQTDPDQGRRSEEQSKRWMAIVVQNSEELLLPAD